MAPIPVICTQCGRLFIANHLFGGTTTIHIRDSTVGPCPHCGGTGRIPDGTYQIADTVTRYLAGPDVSVPDLIRLYRLLRDAELRHASPEEVSHEVAEKVPAAAPIAPYISDRQIGIVALILTVVALIVAHVDTERLSRELAATQAEVEQVKQEIRAQPPPPNAGEIEHAVEAALRAVASPSPSQPKLGRNDPCWCGSGKKYKRCHGR